MKSMQVLGLSVVVLALLSFASPMAFALEDSDIPAEGITQGEFAMWLVEAAGAEGSLPQAALQQDAINFLTNLGIEPKDGWESDKTLTKENIAEMLGLTTEQASGKSWSELIKDAVQNLTNTLNSMATTNAAAQVSPTVSPAGSR